MLPLMFTSMHYMFCARSLAIHQRARSAHLHGMRRRGRAGMLVNLDGPQPEHLHGL